MSLTPKLIPTTNPKGALIGIDNLLVSSDITDAERVLIPNTWERYRPVAGAMIVKFQLSTLTIINYVGIAAHALANESIVIQTATTIGGALTDLDAITVADNGAIMIEFDALEVAEIAIVSTLAADSEIGIVYAGQSLQMPRAIYGGHSPIDLSKKTTFQSNQSENGQFLSKSVIRRGFTSSFAWQFLDPDWYRETFQPDFVDQAINKPFFIKWRPDFYPNDVVFGWVNEDINPSNMGGGSRLMNVGFSIGAHADK